MSQPDAKSGMDHMSDVNMMMEAQFAIMRPYSLTGMRMKKVSDGLRGNKGRKIMLSAAACLWLSRRILNVG